MQCLLVGQLCVSRLAEVNFGFCLGNDGGADHFLQHRGWQAHTDREELTWNMPASTITTPMHATNIPVCVRAWKPKCLTQHSQQHKILTRPHCFQCIYWTPSMKLCMDTFINSAWTTHW
mmetsp:Transcript_3130/g.11995  ORF Transcript_3130/g.11995 Transcript_3130/m.11995 type:complete len:119 (-) Transcript_3130:55-411(-)